MKKSLKKSQEKKKKQIVERNKTIQVLKLEIAVIKKTQTEGVLEKKKLGI